MEEEQRQHRHMHRCMEHRLGHNHWLEAHLEGVGGLGGGGVLGGAMVGRSVGGLLPGQGGGGSRRVGWLGGGGLRSHYFPSFGRFQQVLMA